jgi:hypothetical protein
VNLNELGNCFAEFEQETNYLKQNCSHLVNNNHAQIEELYKRINNKQVQLDTILNENLSFFTTKFQVDLTQLRQSSECLVDILRVFNSQLVGNSANKNDLSCIMPAALSSTMLGANTMIPSNKFKAKSNNLITNDSQNLVKVNQLESFLNFEASYKSKCFLFNKLVRSYSELDRLLAKCLVTVSSSKNPNGFRSNFETASLLHSELEGVMEKCLKADRAISQAYLDKVKSKLAEFDDQNKLLAKVNDFDQS